MARAHRTTNHGMFNSQSVKSRFFVSVLSNVTRAGISFLSALLVARGLQPAGYGDYTFLLGSFAAVIALLDMGSSNAFYTFTSQRPRGKKFYLLYFGWLTFQFAITTLVIVLLMPQSIFTKVWLGHPRGTVLLAFAAYFMQQQVWQTVNQIGESRRQTVRIQVVGMITGISHFLLVTSLLYIESLTVNSIFFLFIAEYLLVAIWAYRVFSKDGGHIPHDEAQRKIKQIFNEFWRYCRPLVILSWVGFFYEFADRWMLQRFGGAGQQGFYQISYQFSAVSLLATTSILKVFWKEIAEAHARDDKGRVEELYMKVNRGLVMLGAIISAFLIPWAQVIVTVFLGSAYLSAVPALMIMFLYPIHQSMGQIGGTMLLASGKTHAYLKVTSAVMLVSIPLSYLLQAPAHFAPVPGLGLGAIGMSLKMVVVNIISVNIQAYVIARIFKWKYDWFYQLVGISLLLGIGYVAKIPADIFYGVDGISNKIALVIPLSITAACYAILVFCLFWTMPWLSGADKQTFVAFLEKLKSGHVRAS